MKHLSICNFGDCLGVSGNRLTVRSKEGELQEYCLTHLRSICIAKNGISISSNLVQACAARGIRLYFLDWTGKSTACISGEHQHAVVQVRKAQFRAIESVLSHFLSREIILAKLRNQRKLFKSTLNNRLHRNFACVIDKSSRGAKLERAFEELPQISIPFLPLSRMIRAIRIRLYPTPDQKKYLAGLFGAVRFCYNKALYLKTHFYKVKGVNLHPIHDLKKLIAIAKKSKKYAWLAEYDCMALQESVRNLNKAYGRFFKKEAGYPRFKSRRGEQSSYHCTGVSAGDDFVNLKVV